MTRPLNEAEAFRAQELLLDRAMYGLDPAQAAELASLGADSDPSFDLAAAALDVATVRREALPPGVAERLLATALGSAAGPAAQPGLPVVPQTLAGVVPARAIDTRPPRFGEPAPSPFPAEPPALVPAPLPSPAPVIPIRRSRAPLYAAWLAAAACLALAVGSFLWARRQEPGGPVAVTAPGPAAPTPAEARTRLLASAGDAVTLAWKSTGDAAGKSASGDVVWSPSQQRGYMRFLGLSPNDPRLTQYQLWIFDQQRDEKYPVDGGVFDVTSTGEVIVPISAKLPVGGAVLFAVTVEAPGGVVVSKRERIVVTAAPAQAG